MGAGGTTSIAPVIAAVALFDQRCRRLSASDARSRGSGGGGRTSGDIGGPEAVELSTKAAYNAAIVVFNRAAKEAREDAKNGVPKTERSMVIMEAALAADAAVKDSLKQMGRREGEPWVNKHVRFGVLKAAGKYPRYGDMSVDDKVSAMDVGRLGASAPRLGSSGGYATPRTAAPLLWQQAYAASPADAPKGLSVDLSGNRRARGWWWGRPRGSDGRRRQRRRRKRARARGSPNNLCLCC
jgi:hypothetical protein